MSDPTFSCSVCRKPIPVEDFEAHRAVTLLKRRFCPRCVESLTSRSSPPPPRKSALRRSLVAGIALTSLILALYAVIAFVRG